MITRRLISAVIPLVLCGTALAQPVPCPQFFPGGQPPALINPKLAQRTTFLCNESFATLASGITHGSLWSAEHLTRASLKSARYLLREGQFYAEERLPFKDRAQLDDYRRSGYDRGHMSPSGDMPDGSAQQQSFSLANIVPQAPALNRGIWAKIEMAVRLTAESHGELFVVTGPAFVGQQIPSIGPSGVLVPSSTWKAVFDPQSGGSGVYVCTNTAEAHCRVTSVEALVQEIGIDPFPALPPMVKSHAIALPEPGFSRRHAGQFSRSLKALRDMFKQLVD